MKININEIRTHHIAPFEIDDQHAKDIFSFYLHLAPTIESNSALDCDDRVLDDVWKRFLEERKFTKENFRFYASSNTISQKQLEKLHLHGSMNVNRSSKGFLCNRKNENEKDIECFLRHLRNSIAHSNVYFWNVKSDSGKKRAKSKRKFFLFDDFNTNGKPTAAMLFSERDLNFLMVELKKDKSKVDQDFF